VLHYGLPNLRIWAELIFWLLPLHFENDSFLGTLALKYSKHSRQCLTTFPNNKKRVEHTMRGEVACFEMWSSTVFSVGYIFSIESKTKEKTEKENRKNLSWLSSDIQTASRLWFSLFKVDELLRVTDWENRKWLDRFENRKSSNFARRTLLGSYFRKYYSEFLRI